METCLNGKPDRTEPMSVEDLRKDLFEEFSSVSSTSVLSQDSLQEKEHLQVYLRIRPFRQSEIDKDESQECVETENSNSVILKAPRHSLTCRLSDKSLPQMAQRFHFSHVYGPETTQEEIFNGTVKSMVKDFLDGANSLVFTYGVSNAGKTFTFLGPENDIGILPRSLNMLFKSIDYKLYENMDLKPQRCREHIRLTKEQQSEEIANKNAILRLMKEVDSQTHLNSSNKFSSRSEGSSIDVLGDFEEQLDSSERFSLNVGTNIKFSLWVSFCEIYNENIFDLLDPVSNCALKRNTLRLAQDVKGNTFVKDLKWVQVSSPEEAYTILKLGKKHQTISCTKLNNLSSRSHSIFSIRILQIEDIGVPRVLKVSEFSLCDLAGSERCAKTQNKGDRLKEAGNINTSLMTLGKCINALRHNQQSKLQQHVPFRESKLTQYFKDFFCGRGKACMIVNINQCASMFDETLNVLKFSAVAQKVVVLNTAKPLPFIPKKSAREVSFLINNADRKKYWRSRKSSFVNWDMSLQDVPETSDGADEEESSEEENMEETIQNEEGSSEEENMEETIHNEGEGDDEITVDKESYEKMLAQITELQNKLVQEKTDKLIMESRIREEVSQEFMQLFEQRECDFSERLEKEREIIEKRGEERLHILKTLVAKQRGGPEIEPNHCESNEEVESILEGMMGSMQDDLADIKKQAEAAQTCLVTLPETQDIATLQTQLATVSEKLAETQKELWMKAKEIEALICNQIQAPNDHLKEAKKKIEAQNEKLQRLTEMCHEKDEVISNLQDVLDRWEESAVSSEKTVQTIKGEILDFKMKCTCMSENGAQMEKDQLVQTGSRKRVCDQQDPVGQPPLKKGPVKGECLCSTVTRQEHRIEGLTKDLSTKEAEVMELKEKVDTLEQQLASVREFLQTERNVKQGLCEQINKVKDELSSSKMKFSEVNDNIKQQASSYEILMSDLQAQRDANKMQTNKVEQFEKEIELLRTEAVEKAEQMQMLQEKNEQLCNMEEVAKANAADLQSTKDLLVKTEQESQEKSSKMETLQNQLVVLGLELENTRTTAAKRDGSHFHATIEALRKECEQIVKVSSEKSQQIQDLEQQAESLKLQVTGQEEQLRQQLNELTVTCNELKEKEALVNQLKAKLEETILNFESERLDANETKQRNSELEKDTISLKGTIKQLEDLLQTSKVHADKVAKMEEQLAEKDSLMACLQNSLKEAQVKLEDAVSQYSLQETKLQDGVQQSQVDLKLANEALAEQEAEQEKKLLKLKNEIAESAIKIKSLSLDLQRKDEDASDLREKLADAKKQIQQVQKEISSMRENEKSLRLKLIESDRVKNQVTRDLASRDRTILQLKNEMSNSTKTEEILQLYQAACKDLKAKEQIIEDMRLALTEQEETQEEQDKVLEAKIKEIECLAAELEDWKRKCFFHEKDNNQNLKTECRNTESENARKEANNLQESLKQSEEKHQADRRKWLDEKMLLIRQAKEAEGRRNQEMKKLMEDLERHVKLQTEVDSQTKQLSEKEDQLQKWRQERDELVAALEVQLKNLFASNLQKDQELKKLQEVASAQPHEVNKDELQLTPARKEAEIAELKEYVSNMKDSKDKHQAAVTASGDTSAENKLEAKSTEMANTKFVQQLQDEHSKLTSSIKTVCDGPTTKIAALPRSSSAITLHEEENEVVLNQSVLDSSEVSTENGRTSRFPKSELDIQFTPLRPNKMTVTRQGGDSSVTVKITRTAKKRKSNAMEKTMLSGCWKNKSKLKATSPSVSQDPVEVENKKNTNSRVIASSQSIKTANNGKEVSPATQTKRPSPLRKRTSYSSLRSVTKKDGALQKIGDFFQSSPTLLHSKAKKLIGSRSTAKSPETDVCKETEYKPRKSKRKLYKTEISSPLDIPLHPVVGLDQDEKESDHLIIKRRLRTRTAKR